MMFNEVVERALKVARGKWQRQMIKTAYSRLRGGANNYYCGSYYRSLEGLSKRLQGIGIPSRIFVPQRGTFYLIYGDEWVSLFDSAQHLRYELMKVRENLYTLVNQNPQLRKVLSRQHVFANLRSLISEAFYTVWKIAADFTDYLEAADEEEKERIWRQAQERLESLKQRLANFAAETRLGVLLL